MTRLNWTEVGPLTPTEESLKRVENLEVEKAVWKLVYRLGGQCIAYVGSTDTLHRHIRESIYGPTKPNWPEFFRRDLVVLAGTADLFITNEGSEETDRKSEQIQAIKEAKELRCVILNKRPKQLILSEPRVPWPDWLTDIENVSKKCAEADREFPAENFSHLRVVWDGGDAIEDFDPAPPMRRPTTLYRFARDPEVRRQVRQRAGGRCEYCGKLGFSYGNGVGYVECHHIIALANDGEDRLTNVIALCADHHREAHFGDRGEDLEAEMQAKLRQITGQT